MSDTHIAIGLFIILTTIILPLIIKKYDLKDDIKYKSTLPIGTAKFRAFMKLTLWIVLGLVFLTLFMSTLDLLGLEF